MRKYTRPDFLVDIISQEAYEKWLYRKARAHVRRDRNRGNKTATVEAYKVAIHQAVCESNGKDAYTDEPLDWTLIGVYRNEDAKQGGRAYKQQFALLPTVDHVGDGLGPADFKICGWQTNDAKNDLPYEAFLALCKKVVEAAKNRGD